MKTYITTMTSRDGTLREGPNINAYSFAEADAKARELGIQLQGELKMVSYG